MPEELRILHVIPSLGKGGAERLVIDICRVLENQEVDYRLVVLSEVNEYPELTRDLKLVFCKVWVNSFLAGSKKNDLREWSRLITEFKPTIIHSHIYFADLVVRFRIMPGVKYFSHLHGRTTQFEKPPLSWLIIKPRKFSERTLERWNVKKLYAKSDTLFLCVSEYYKTYLETHLNYKQNKVLHNAIEYSRFFCDRKTESSGLLQLVSVGRLVEHKNHSFLIWVAEGLKKKGIEFKLNILGDGPLKADLKNLIKELFLENEVFLMGNVDKPEEYYYKADLYVHAAWDEPFGLTLLEAMATGLPVITFDGKGNRDLIVQGKNGFMLFEQDAEKFADRILEVWGNKGLYREMSAFAQEFAKGYDIKEYVETLLKIYKQAL